MFSSLSACVWSGWASVGFGFGRFGMLHKGVMDEVPPDFMVWSPSSYVSLFQTLRVLRHRFPAVEHAKIRV